MRVGVLARKLGMTRVFTATGEHLPVTVLHLDDCQIVGQCLVRDKGYSALQVGAGVRKASRTSRALRGHFAKIEVAPKARVCEFLVTEDNLIEVGALMRADHFVVGQQVDTTGVSNGKGFAGVIKRHNFSMQRATHGVSRAHRAHGSTGNRTEPGRVFKGKKMAGHLGAARVTVQNLTVVRTDVGRGLILVKGAVPGAKGSWIMVKDSVKKMLPKEAPLPGAFIIKGIDEAAPEASLEVSGQSVVAGENAGVQGGDDKGAEINNGN